MAVALSYVFLFALVVAGNQIAAHKFGTARVTCRGLFSLLAILIAGLAISGIGHQYAFFGNLHLTLGHLLTALAWCTSAFVFGVITQAGLGKHRWMLVVQAVLLICFLGFSVLAGVTGYLGPTNFRNRPYYEETYNRFVVLHITIAPAILAMITMEWIWFLRKTNVANESAKAEKDTNVSPPPNSSNPYQSPTNS